MIQGDYNRGGGYGSPIDPNSQADGYGGFGGPGGGVSGYGQQYGSGVMDQPYPPPPVQPGYPNQPPNPYQQPTSFYNRPTGIAGAPAQATPAIPALSEEDIKIFKETQKNVMFKRFFPAAVIGCGAIYMAHQKKLFKPSVWTYGIYVCSASYITQLSARNELKRKVAESPSMSPFAQQVRMQLGYVNKSADGSFTDDSGDFNYAPVNNQPSTGPQYSPYNRFHRQRQAKGPSEFIDELAADGKDLTEFSADVRSPQSRGSAEFAPDDVLADDSGFRTRRVVDLDPSEKSERPKTTYEELRMRNRAQYTSIPSPGNPPYTQSPQSMNGNPAMYNRPGPF